MAKFVQSLRCAFRNVSVFSVNPVGGRDCLEAFRIEDPLPQERAAAPAAVCGSAIGGGAAAFAARSRNRALPRKWMSWMYPCSSIAFAAASIPPASAKARSPPARAARHIAPRAFVTRCTCRGNFVMAAITAFRPPPTIARSVCCGSVRRFVVGAAASGARLRIPGSPRWKRREGRAAAGERRGWR